MDFGLQDLFDTVRGGFEAFIDFETFKAELDLAKSANAAAVNQAQQQAPVGSTSFIPGNGIDTQTLLIFGAGGLLLFFAARQFMK